MAQITTYGTLKSEVQAELSRNGVGDLADRAPRWVQQAEAHLFTQLRVQEMESSASVTVSASTRTSSQPTRFLAPRVLYISGSPPLEKRNLQELWHVYAELTTAQPLYYAISNSEFVWAPLPDAGYTVTCEYYQKPAAFSADGDTNTVLTTYPDTYLYAACLAAAASLGNGPLMQAYAHLFENAVQMAHASNAGKIGEVV